MRHVFRRRRLAVPSVEQSVLRTRDLVAETLAGVLQRPARASLTVLGTVLGVAALVAVLGLTTTVSGQISARFNALVATEVTVEDTGGADSSLAPVSFPDDAEVRVTALNGVRHAGIVWTVSQSPRLTITATPLLTARAGEDLRIVAASPGALRTTYPRLRDGRIYNEFHDQRTERVAVLGSVAARRLGVTRLDAQPAIFIGGTAFTVIGVIDDFARHAELLFNVLVPHRTAEALWGPPDGSDRAAMLIDTDLGAAPLVARQVALALRPDAPELFKVVPPPDPRSLREGVTGDLNLLFLLLAGVCLVVGAFGIANTTLIAVLERVPEIGLRRALGARPGHVAAQFLAESALLGMLGGLVGTAMGVLAVVGVAVLRRWTPIVAEWTVLAGPFIGLVTGLLAGVYPAMRAARIEPVEALRR